MSDARKHQTQGPFRTDQIRSGDACELSQGHPIVCAPTGRVDTIPSGLGFAVLEYAGHGQDEDELKLKIRQLLEGGTRWVWVMRLTDPRRVEVHEGGVAVRVFNVDDTLTAPGVLALPVPVRALFERDAAHEITLRNLLSSKGYSGLEAVRDEGLGPLVHLFERKLARPLTASERAALRDRLATGGPARLGDVVIDLGAADLDAWIKDPSVP